MDNGRDFKTVASWIKFGLLWLKNPVFHNSCAGIGIYLVAMEWMCWRGFKLDWYKSCAVGFVNRSWANLDNCQTFMKLLEPLVPGGDIAQLRIKSGSREEELRGKSQKIKNHMKGAEQEKIRGEPKKETQGRQDRLDIWKKIWYKEKERSLTAEVKGIKGLLWGPSFMHAFLYPGKQCIELKTFVDFVYCKT